MSDECKQGAKTTEEPFTSKYGVYEHVIMFRKELFQQVGGVHPREVEAVTRLLNRAYQKGFSDAAEKLMNKED